MAIDVTPGSATAVAWDTEANAAAYFLARNITTWTGATDVLEAALVRGTDYLERTYADQWIGLKATDAQSLAWPRVDAVDLDGYSYGINEVPTALKHANFEAALLVLTGTELEPVLSRGNSIKRKRVKGSVLESETEYFGSAATRDEITSIDGLLLKAGLIRNGGNTVELLRV